MGPHKSAGRHRNFGKTVFSVMTGGMKFSADGIREWARVRK